MQLLHFYGAHPHLSRLELNALQGGRHEFQEKFAIIDGEKSSTVDIAPRFGSITHISEFIEDTSKPLDALKILIEQSSAKNIAITNYSGYSLTKADLFSLKDQVKRKFRLISLNLLSPDLVPIKKQHADHFILTGENTVKISRTIWIHEFNEWNRRDRYKPYKNIKKGMMPPKLARIMLNLVAPESATIADPFCGTGTVLLEALLLGHSIYGADTDRTSVAGSIANINWLRDQYSLGNQSYDVRVNDATSISDIWTGIQGIATEPFMGKLVDDDEYNSSRFSRTQLTNMTKGLEKLYKGCLKDWHTILNPNGKVAILIPEFNYKGKVIELDTIDTCENLGYNIIALEKYTKPSARLVRNLLLLEKNGKN